MIRHFSDVVVVGAGLAGERAAIEIKKAGLNVCIVTLVPPRQSHSNAAQGGIQASLANAKESIGDNWRLHFDDTIKGSDWGADQDVVETVTKLAPRLIRELDFWGAAFSRTSEGKINQRAFGGGSKPRAAFASDGTGHILLNTLDSIVMSLDIPVFNWYQLLSLIHNQESVFGITALNRQTGDVEVFLAKAVVLATGGAGRLYRESTNSEKTYGDGQAAALLTGLVPLGNPEAIQFHPTGLVPTSILVTEGCRGDGGALLDKDGKEFMWDYSKKGNMASRDVVSRGMMTHIRKGFGVNSPYGPHLWLDIKRLGKEHIKTNLADVDFLCRTFIGIDPTKEYIPVRPAQHYTMFGIKTDKDCQVYGLKNFYAVGECGCWDMHGFNRLGGNSLLETIAAGYIAGCQIIEELRGLRPDSNFSSEAMECSGLEYARQQGRIRTLIASQGKENVFVLLKELQDIMTEKVGIFRNGQELQKAVYQILSLIDRARYIGLKAKGVKANSELQLALRLEGMLKMALCTAYAALLRTESRGAHFREDYPARDDEKWLKRTLAYFPTGNRLPIIKYESVKITLLPPGERGY